MTDATDKPYQEEGLRLLAPELAQLLAELYGRKMGFILLVSPMNESDCVADFISNCARESSVAWMKETIQRMEKNEIIPAVEGQA